MPLEEYAKNLKALIHHIQQYGTQQLILLTPPPVNEAARVEHNKQVRIILTVPLDLILVVCGHAPENRL